MMVVINAVSVPRACHGVIARYLIRVGEGLYVGDLSARVRDLLWEQLCVLSLRGRITMVHPGPNPQGFVITGHGHPKSWLTTIDGLTFLRVPLTRSDLGQLNRD